MTRRKLGIKRISILLIVLCLLAPHVYAICDFNDDGDCDTVDIDILYRESDFFAGEPPVDAKFDLNGDGIVDLADQNAWLAEAADHNGFASPFVTGDANLDGSVNAADLNALALRWQQSDKTWSQGDFTGDGRVDAGDLMSLAINWQYSIPRTAAPVPEPTGLMLLGVAVCVGAWVVGSKTKKRK